jgi:hypothetical protein
MVRSAVRVPGDHVAGVLDVAGRVGDDELSGRGGEVPVGDVDGDPLLALGPQAVGQQGQVGVLVPPLAADPLDRLELVLEDGLGVVEQSTDQRALAVVDRTGGGECEGAPSEVALPLAVLHRRLADPVVGPGGTPLGQTGGSHLDHDVLGPRLPVDSTAPVQVMSPTVR